MKKSTLLILCIFISATIYSQTWFNLTSGSSQQFTGISFPSDNTGYVSGASGTILKTTNGGASWISQTTGTVEHISAVYFRDSLNGFAAAHTGTLIKTADGGTTWSLSPTGVTEHLTFVGEMNGSALYATGYNGVILKSLNSGTSWTVLNTGTVQPLYGVYFTDATTGFAVGNGGTILKTIDSGNSWTSLTTGTSMQLLSVYFTNTNTGYATGGDGGANVGVVLKTTDSGLTWNIQTFSNNYFGCVKFLNANTGFVSGGNVLANTSTILKTNDGGVTWIPQSSNANRQYYCSFPSFNVGYTCGLNGTILKTSGICDAVPQWSSLSSASSSLFTGAFFLNDSTGFVSGSNGAILKTTNYGTNWSTLTTGVSTHVSYIYFSDANTGFAVSGTGLLKTINGGASWFSITTGTSTTLTFVGEMNGSGLYITGYGGLILKSIDAGVSWSVLNSGTSNPLYGVHFTDSLTGYAIGNNGTIIKTSNGGISWTALTTGTSMQLLSVYFTDANTGYATGGDGAANTGIILKTSNAGASWTSQSLANAYMGSVKFVNSTTGFIVGGDVSADTSKIFKTIDAGVNWTMQNISSSRQYGSCFTSENVGYTCGLDGTILKYFRENCPQATSSNIIITISSINASSFGVCNGSASASVTSNSLGGYSYLWNTGQTTSSVSGLCAGTYIITVTDSAGVSGSGTVVIGQPADSAYVDPSFEITTISANVSISGNCDGTASVTATGGMPPYTYNWSTGDTTPSVSGLCSNVYYIIVNDANGQSISATVYISEPNDTITNTIISTPVDTLSIPPIDTCIIDFSLNIPIDSAFISSFTVVDSTHLLVHWVLYHNGVITPITTSVQYSNVGINLLYLTLNCSGVFRELHSLTVEDAVYIDYGMIGVGPLATGISNDQLSNKIIPAAYPNPVNDNLNVEFTLTEKNNVNIKLLNSIGQLTYLLNQYCEAGENKIKINTENLNSGIYFIQIIINDKSTVYKIIK